MDDASIKKTIHINPGLLLPSSSGSKKQPKKNITRHGNLSFLHN